MASLKDLFLEIEDSNSGDYNDNSIEVYADSVNQALEIASRELGVDISHLDYEVVEKGTKGLFGIGRLPYRVIITPLKINEEHDDLDEIEMKLTGGYIPGISVDENKDIDGTFSVRVSKTGIWVKVTKPKGKGLHVAVEAIENKCYSLRLGNFDRAAIAKAVKKADGEKIKIGEWLPNPAYDSTMRVEATEDELKAFVYFNPPKFSGRHMDYEDVIDGLRNAGAVTGIREEAIKEYLEEMDYKKPLLAAEGQYPRDGKNAYVDYKVKIDKSTIKFEEDDSGKVDFRNLELLENVVVGQLLAVKVPLEEGIPGRTITNRIIPAKSGKDVSIKYGKGTILSEDETELTAEINGQVVYKLGRI